MKVKSFRMRLRLDPAKDWGETEVVVNYDPTDKNTQNYHKHIPKHRFYINLPTVVADALAKKDSRGDTQEEAIAAFEVDLERFRNMKTKKNKVIIFAISTNPTANEKESWRNRRGFMVDVWAGVFEETVAIDGAGNRRYSYEPIESPFDFPGGPGDPRKPGEREVNQIPWTPESEAFFVWVAVRMGDLTAALDKLRIPARLIGTINAGLLLPLGKTENERKESD